MNKRIRKKRDKMKSTRISSDNGGKSAGMSSDNGGKSAEMSSDNGGKSAEIKSNCRFKAAIFDFDGTLVDSMPYWESVCSDYVREYLKKEPAPGLDDWVKTLTLEEAADVMVNDYADEGTAEDILARVVEMMTDRYANVIPEKPGMRAIIEDLRAAGVRMLIATASYSDMIIKANQRLGLTDYFETVFSCSDLGLNKRQPEIYYRAAEFLGSKPEETLVFEDAIHAATTAFDAGFYVIGVSDASNVDELDVLKQKCKLYLADNSQWPGADKL